MAFSPFSAFAETPAAAGTAGSGAGPRGEQLIFLQLGNPKMVVNGTEKEIDEGRGTAPVVKNGRTLAPIRAIIEQYGGTVGWDEKTKGVTLRYKKNEIKLTIGSKTAYLDGIPVRLETAPEVINGRTMLPVRFVAESCKLHVFWDGDQSVITITSDPNNKNVPIPREWAAHHGGTQGGRTDPKTDVGAAGKLRVHFIDVGQGDSVFIELPNKKTLLIDGGPSMGTTANYIRGKGYDHVDYVVATHPDADHITGLPEVLNAFTVDTFYMPRKEHTTKIFESMLDAVKRNGCKAEYAAAGKSVVSSADLNVYFTGPVKSYADNNNSSAVLKLEYKKNSFLFTGDAEAEAEADMLSGNSPLKASALKADVLKVGHHGSNSSTSEALLAAVKPKIAVISVGKDNKYGHPTAAVWERLDRYGADIYRTDEAGTIIITGDGTTYAVDKLKSTIRPNAPPAAGQPQGQNQSQNQPQQGSTGSQNQSQSQTGSQVQNQPQGQNQPQDQNQTAVVYRTKTGTKYHSAGCSYLKSSIRTTVSEAKRMGLTPCSRCHPPR